MTIGAKNERYEIIERELEKIESIVSCRFVLGQADEIKEIHIVSNGKRSPKQISRDIQSVLIATYNLHIDYKMISIAEIPEKGLKNLESRLKIETISHENRGSRTSLKVVLSDEKGNYENSVEGINTSRNIDRMLVKATLKNVETAYGEEDIFILEDVKSIQMSSDKVIVVVIICLLGGQEKRLSGSCLVRNDHMEAVVKATLDAINRYISK